MCRKVSITPNTPDTLLDPALSLSSELLALSAPPPIQTKQAAAPEQQDQHQR